MKITETHRAGIYILAGIIMAELGNAAPKPEGVPYYILSAGLALTGMIVLWRRQRIKK